MFTGEPVTRLRRHPTGTDRVGNPRYEETKSVLEETAAFDPGGSTEPVQVGATAVATSPTLYFPGTFPDLTEADAVLVRGIRYTIEGQPAQWRSPFTGGPGVGGTVVELRHVEQVT